MARAPFSNENMQNSNWLNLLNDEGIDVFVIESASDLDTITSEAVPHLAILDTALVNSADVPDCIEKCSKLRLPLIALVPRHMLSSYDIRLEFDDFVASPPDPDEMATRVRRVLWQNRSEQADDVLQIGDLSINPSTYEVSLNGKRINLRFKEYELLRLLAANPGRVYSREALLSSIWGYDYFGGTRTVDVHIRRLRSKIEDFEHSFIETIWNVGYRFRDSRNTS